MKHHEVSQKYSAARRIFNSLLSVSSFSGDETQKKYRKKWNKGNDAHLFLSTHAHLSRLKHCFDLHLLY